MEHHQKVPHEAHHTEIKGVNYVTSINLVNNSSGPIVVTVTFKTQHFTSFNVPSGDHVDNHRSVENGKYSYIDHIVSFSVSSEDNQYKVV